MNSLEKLIFHNFFNLRNYSAAGLPKWGRGPTTLSPPPPGRVGVNWKRTIKTLYKGLHRAFCKTGFNRTVSRMKPRFETFWFSGAVTPQWLTNFSSLFLGSLLQYVFDFVGKLMKDSGRTQSHFQKKHPSLSQHKGQSQKSKILLRLFL